MMIDGGGPLTVKYAPDGIVEACPFSPSHDGNNEYRQTQARLYESRASSPDCTRETNGKLFRYYLVRQTDYIMGGIGGHSTAFMENTYAVDADGSYVKIAILWENSVVTKKLGGVNGTTLSLPISNMSDDFMDLEWNLQWNDTKSAGVSSTTQWCGCSVPDGWHICPQADNYWDEDMSHPMSRYKYRILVPVDYGIQYENSDSDV